MHLAVAGDVRMANAGSVNSGAFIQAQKGMSISADSLQLVGAAGGRAVGINNSQGLQSVTTTGSGPNGWGIELTNNGSLSASDDGVYIKSGGSQGITASNGGGILLDGVGGRTGIFGAAQTISAAGDIVLLGGVDSLQLWSEISSANGQSITARSLSIVNRAGPSSTGIFTPNGPQTITTTGGIGGNAADYGISIRNLGATGIDQAGFGAAAYIVSRTGEQTISVSNSRGVLLEGVGGDAVIENTGTEQSINVSGAIDIKAGVGAALLRFDTGASQTISAGSITMTGGTADQAFALIEAAHGTQDITVGGALTLTGGTAPGPNIPDLSNPPTDCGAVSGCAVVITRTGLQTIDANSISITGGSAGTENLATIRGDAGQDITIGSGGLTMQGGGGPGLRNYAFIENYSGDQILTFAAGAPLSLTGGSAPADDQGVIDGTAGIKHFASIFAAPGSTSQQILGNPVITLTGGPSGGNGDASGFTYTWRGNNAAIFAETGSQTIHAQSIESRGGLGNENNASIDAWEDGAPQTILVIGDIVAVGGGGLFTTADFISHGTQTITARSILLEGAAGGAAGLIRNTSEAQTITTTGSGANGWGIELVDKGALMPAYISSSGLQQITATNGGGILLDAIDASSGGVRIEGTSLSIDTTGELKLVGGSGPYAVAAVVSSADQTISARSIQMIATPGAGQAQIYAVGGDQDITTTGSGPNGWGIELANKGGDEVFITSHGNQSIQALNGGGILLDADGGDVSIGGAVVFDLDGFPTSTGTQTILIDGSGGNALELPRRCRHGVYRWHQSNDPRRDDHTRLRSPRGQRAEQRGRVDLCTPRDAGGQDYRVALAARRLGPGQQPGYVPMRARGSLRADPGPRDGQREARRSCSTSVRAKSSFWAEAAGRTTRPRSSARAISSRPPRGAAASWCRAARAQATTRRSAQAALMRRRSSSAAATCG